MVKTVIKEFFIVILFLATVGLVMCIAFYDFMPTNKVAPSKVEQYTLSEEMQNELNETLATEDRNIIITYRIDSSTLKNYERQKEYDKGKANPFGGFTTENTTGNTSNNTTNNTSTKNSVSSSNTSNQGYFNITGK